MQTDAKRALTLVFLFLGIQVVLALIGVAPFPFSDVAEELAYVSLGYVAFYIFLLQAFSGLASRRGLCLNLLLGLSLGGGQLFIAELGRDQALPVSARVYVVLGGLGLVALVMLYLRWRQGTVDVRDRIKTLAAFFVLLWFLSPLPHAALGLTSLLHPATHDPIAFHFDQALGLQPSVILALVLNALPWFYDVIHTAYVILPWGFAVIFALFIRYPGCYRFDLLRFWVLSGLFAYVAYHFVPVAGPVYLFGGAFPASIPLADTVPWVPVILPPSARNGIPSMHFGWALALWLMSMHFPSRWARHGFALFLGATVLATLGLGEHYLVDLVVSVPFISGLYAYCLREAPWQVRRTMVCLGVGLTLFWMLFLRFGVGVVEALPVLVPLAELTTVISCAIVFRRLKQVTIDQPVSPPAAVLSASAVVAPAREFLWVGGIFVLSGFAGLVYEVVFSKALALTFGSTALATYTVLATYMGGMALGSWLGGWGASRVREPVVAYALCELSIGAYCLLTPLLFPLMRDYYVLMAEGIAPDATILIVLRVALGAAVLLVPTVLMGATLPLMARFLGERRHTLGVSVSVLYGANTVGAALGALLTGYLIIPVFGIKQTTLLAAALSMLVAYLGLRLTQRAATGSSQDEKTDAAAQPPQATTPSDVRLGRAAIAVLAIGGCVTLLLEVNYIHLLAVVAGNSVYAFSLMLGTFLAGLSLGAIAARRLLHTRWTLGVLLVWLEAGLAIAVLAGVFAWEHIPAYFADYANYAKGKGFGSREFIRGVVCALAMLPPTVFIGAIYPIAFEAVGRAFPEKRLVMLGRAMALNTLGNISGVLIGGFLLLPMIGALSSIQLIAAISVGLALLLLMALPQRGWQVWLPLLPVIGFAVVQPASFNYSALASGANVYFAAQGFGSVIDHAESIDGGLTTVAHVPAKGSVPELKTLLTNGKFQGNNSFTGEMQAQVGFALAPLMHTAARERALVIGYGTGATSRTIHEAGFAQVDIVELSRDILEMADRHFSQINAGVSRAPGVSTYVTDGRNFLLLQPRRYDVISMEITSIWFAGAASLYNREFYQLAKSRLSDHGVMQQWIQLHHLRGEDLMAIVSTIRSEFQYVWLYMIGGQGILIATNDASAFDVAAHREKLRNTASLRPLLAIYGEDLDSLSKDTLLTPEVTDQFVADIGLPEHLRVSTDDNVRLEYGTPRGNVLDTAESKARIVTTLRNYSAAKANRSSVPGN